MDCSLVKNRWMLDGAAFAIAAMLASGCFMATEDASAGGDGGQGFEGDDGGQGLPGDGGDGSVGDDDDDATPPDPDEDPEAIDPPAECDTSEEVSLFLSPDDSNSMSSPVQAREAALDGFSALTAVPIRPWEFMNYYSFDYPPAESGQVVVTPSLVADPELPGVYTMQIAVTSEHVNEADRQPMSITLVLDESGSMGGHAMEMQKASCRAIAGSLQEGDKVSIVTWDTENQTVLAAHDVTGPNDPTLLAAIENLEAGGGTDLHGGLTAGYELAQQTFEVGRINRIVLISDGGANAGVTDINTIAANSDKNGEEGIYMVGVGVGDATTYNDMLMDEVTDAGKGASVFINDDAEAQRIFGRDFINTFSVAARDVQVRMDLPAGFSVTRFSGEEINTDPEQVEPQHLAMNDSMIFHQQIETCAPDLVSDETPITVAVVYDDARTYQSREVEVQTTFGELLREVDARHLKGAAVFSYAEALQAKKTGEADITAALEALIKAEEANPEDPELAEIRAVLQTL